MKRLALALCLAAAPAGAQDLIYSDAASQSCVAEAADAAARLSCIGRAANICMRASPSGDTTAGMAGCFGRERDFWDRVLNQNYQLAQEKAAKFDAAQPGAGPDRPGLSTRLREMQLVWIAFRDATCAFEHAQWGGGSGGGPAHTACLMRVTGQQALYLYEAWLIQ